jgi:hypothetical protein
MNQLPTDGKCQRCRKETNGTSMSIFNTEHCCIKCLELEKKHPKFQEAYNAELAETLVKNYNFPGIGLPSGYHEWAKEQQK